MFSLLNYFQRYRKFKGKLKWEKLKSMATIGSDFCTSPMYSDKFLHIYNNVHLKGLLQKNRIKIGDYCNLSISLTLHKNSDVEIGNYVFMNSNCRFNISNRLKIGSNCLFGSNVQIWDSDNHSLDISKRHEQTMQIPKKRLNSFDVGGGDVIIGNDVWIGMDVLILGGVKIGEGSVVAARSVVTKDIPPFVLAAGVPAKVIKSIT
jgi:acetyltransferase-like isoleucine patch superfamily enzyme